MKFKVVVFGAMLAVAGCSEPTGEPEQPTRTIEQAHRVTSSSPSRDHTFVKSPLIQLPLFDFVIDITFKRKLSQAYSLMYASGEQFRWAMGELAQDDPDGELSFVALRTAYKNSDDSDPNYLRQRYNIISLMSFVAAPSSVGFFEDLASSPFDSCDAYCTEWNTIIRVAAVRGLYRVHQRHERQRGDIEQAMLRVIGEPDTTDEATLEALEYLRREGVSHAELTAHVDTEKTALLQIESLTELPEGGSQDITEESFKYGSPDEPPTATEE